jgi:hypothetical protein
VTLEKLPVGGGAIGNADIGGLGMRWKEAGAAVVLSLRTLVLTSTRWNQFWNKLNQYGFPVAP